MDIKKVAAFFVLPETCKTPAETYDEMQEAFESCKQTMISVQWIQENDKTTDLSKTDIIVFQSFEGEYFEYVSQNFKSVVVGPWCLLVCLTEGRTIPNVQWPIFNVAMSDCVVTCSHLPKKDKQEIRQKVQRMGGIYTETLVQKNTHLVTDTVLSEKYVQGAEVGVKIMTPLWVETVWNRSRKANVHANDDEFNHFKCPPFYNLTICPTGIRAASERKELQKVVNENGGTLTGALNLKTTDVLVCSGPESTNSDKYKAARNSNTVKCVTIEWVKDSLAKGYALPFNLYTVKKCTSTPTKENDDADPDFSTMSAIAPPNRFSERSVLQETAVSQIGCATPTLKRKNSFRNEHNELVDGIDMKVVKRSGPFLDGCSVYIAGFGAEQREKLCKILNFSGATRYDDLSNRLTHVIVGDPTCNDLKVLQSKDNCHASIVTIQWLIDSMEKQHPLPEINYIVNQAAMQSYCNSPLSKKGLYLLRANNTVMEKELKEKESANRPVDCEIDSIQQYFGGINTGTDDTLAGLLQNTNSTKKIESHPKPSTSRLAKTPTLINPKTNTTTVATPTCTMDSEYSSQPLDIFEGLKFVISGFTDDEHEKLKVCIESMAGTIVSKLYKGIPDYAIVPVFGSTFYNTATEIVNDLWVAECQSEGEIRVVLYYHRQIPVESSQPLQGCVVTISSYSRYERNFLANLIQQLGGTFQEQFARISCPEKNIFASTHLVSLEASGKKYTAALRWKLPVVNKEWLLDCARSGSLVCEKDYLVGDSVAPERAEASQKLDELSNRPCIGGVAVKNTGSTPKVGTPTFQRLQEEFSTPTPRKPLLEDTKTPKKTISTPDYSSQVTPVSKIMEKFRQNNLLDSDSPLPRAITHVDTPETPLGAFIRPNPSPNLRKEMARYLNTFPDFKPPTERRLSTPLSELKRRLWDKICPTTPGDEPADCELEGREVSAMEIEDCGVVEKVRSEETPDNIQMREKLLALEEEINASGAKRKSCVRLFAEAEKEPVPASESQPYSVEWDYSALSQKAEQAAKAAQKVFIISGVDADVRQEIVKQLKSLSVVVSELSDYDPSCTHLVCPKPARNEKTLACIAAGKWILHTSYVTESYKAKKLLDEELFEYGNPRASGNISLRFDEETEIRMKAIHWWRKEVAKRGYGAFHDMRAIVVASKREMIVRVIEAGGGMVVDAKPPFTENVYATHCLLEAKSVKDFSKYIPLAKQGIYCVNTVYISEYLHMTSTDIRDSILPYFSKYYSETS